MIWEGFSSPAQLGPLAVHRQRRIYPGTHFATVISARKIAIIAVTSPFLLRNVENLIETSLTGLSKNN